VKPAARAAASDTPKERVIAALFSAFVTSLLTLAFPWMSGIDELLDQHFAFSDTQYIWAPVLIVAAAVGGFVAGLTGVSAFWERFLGHEEKPDRA
jgi:hypothetical protein